MSVLNLNNASKLYYGNTEAQKVYKGDRLLYPVPNVGVLDLLSLSPSLWLDANDNSTITLVSEAVSEWRDKSGNSRHAIQSMINSRPIIGTMNGKTALGFNGVNYWLSCPYDLNNILPFNVFIVTKGSGPFLNSDYEVSPPRGFIINATGLFGRYTTSGSFLQVPYDNPLSGSVGGIINLFFDTNLVTPFVSGVQNSVSQSYDPPLIHGTFLEIGAIIRTTSTYYNGVLAEIIFIPSILSLETRNKIEG